MSQVCLDSTFLISYLRGNHETKKKLFKLKEEKVILYTTSINVTEIFYGYFKAFGEDDTHKKEFEQIKSLFSILPVYSLTLTSAIRASHIYHSLEQRGELIGMNDTYIASIVLENGNTIITDNVKHFERIKGIKTI